MAKYKVRSGFWLHDLEPDPIAPGTIVDLTPDQAANYAAQVEPVRDPLDHDGDGHKGGSIARKGKARAG